LQKPGNIGHPIDQVEVDGPQANNLRLHGKKPINISPAGQGGVRRKD